MIEEIQALLQRGLTEEQLTYYGLEYKFVTEHVCGHTTYNEMRNRLEIAIHQFAKRQMTYFRGMERRGVNIHWIDGTLAPKEQTEQVLVLLHH